MVLSRLVTLSISFIPTYFENKESPIICNLSIINLFVVLFFYYNKLVTELDIENHIPDS